MQQRREKEDQFKAHLLEEEVMPNKTKASNAKKYKPAMAGKPIKKK